MHALCLDQLIFLNFLSVKELKLLPEKEAHQKNEKNESMEFVKSGGMGQTPNPKKFGIHFGSIDI